jgi:hypothetical protein
MNSEIIEIGRAQEVILGPSKIEDGVDDFSRKLEADDDYLD